MVKKIAIFLIVIFLVNPFTAFANEDPPGPGLFEFIFGGTIFYKQVGITLGVLYKAIAKMDPKELWRPYNPQKPVKLYPGFTMEFDINSENGRKSDQKLKTVVKHSDKASGQMVEIGSFEGQFGVVKYTIPAYNTGYNYVRIYTEGGESKTQDQVAGFVYYVEPNPVESVVESVINNSSSSAAAENFSVNQEETETGTVSIYLYDDMSLIHPSDKKAKIAIYSNGKRIPETKGEFIIISRMHSIEGVPAGTIELKLPKGEGGWMIKSATSKWELKKGDELIINFVREGGK